MITTPKKALVAACILGLCSLTAPTEVSAQAKAELEPTAEIPHRYRSWSLFLVCNPAWIIQNGDKGPSGYPVVTSTCGLSLGRSLYLSQ